MDLLYFTNTHMKGSPRSTTQSDRINQQRVATHVSEMVKELQESTHVIEISTESISHIERSIFYRDDVKRAYQLNPKEHPGLIGVLDTVFEEIKSQTHIDLTRKTPSTGYLLTVTNTNNTTTGESTASLDDLQENGVYSTSLNYAITNQPFKRYGFTYQQGIDNRINRVEEKQMQDIPQERSHAASEIPSKGWFTDETIENVFEKPVLCERVTLTQKHVTTNLAKLIGVLDSIAFIRTHPMITNGVCNDYPVQLNFTPSEITPKEEMLFTKECNEFLLETAPGWRLRWIVETISNDPKPLQNIVNAANISMQEAEITLSLMVQWGIVTEHAIDGQKCYKLDSRYEGWKNKSSLTGFEMTEPSYMVNTFTPESVINNSFQALSSC